MSGELRPVGDRGERLARAQLDAVLRRLTRVLETKAASARSHAGVQTTVGIGGQLQLADLRGRRRHARRRCDVGGDDEERRQRERVEARVLVGRQRVGARAGLGLEHAADPRLGSGQRIEQPACGVATRPLVGLLLDASREVLERRVARRRAASRRHDRRTVGPERRCRRLVALAPEQDQ